LHHPATADRAGEEVANPKHRQDVRAAADRSWLNGGSVQHYPAALRPIAATASFDDQYRTVRELYNSIGPAADQAVIERRMAPARINAGDVTV
jgi:hypothetical protein